MNKPITSVKRPIIRTPLPYKLDGRKQWLQDIKEWRAKESIQKAIREWFAKNLWGDNNAVYPTWDALPLEVKTQWLVKADYYLRYLTSKGAGIRVTKTIDNEEYVMIEPLIGKHYDYDAEKKTTIIVRCGWCDKSMGTKEGHGVSGISHGMCPECFKKVTGEELPKA